MWDFISLIPDHCLSFNKDFSVFLGRGPWLGNFIGVYQQIGKIVK